MARRWKRPEDKREWHLAARALAAAGAPGPVSEPARASAPARIPPPVTRGEHPDPVTQEHGGQVELVLSDGRVLAVMRRTGPRGDVAFIDWLNFTIHEDSGSLWGCGTPVTDDQVITALSWKLESILGYGVTSRCERGRNFYHRAWVLGDGWGFVCHGGQRNTILVMLSGAGLAAAKVGWEVRLYQFLSHEARNGRITRCDVAHDCYEGEYTVDRARAEYEDGMFRLPKAPVDPDCEMRGNWLRRRDGQLRSLKGRSFYVGHRTNGKFCRVYEKGRQLGCPDSEWVRVEVEFKSVDRLIPYDILLQPGRYLTGAYPAFSWISGRSERIRTVRETAQCDRARKEAWIKRQCGRDLWALVGVEAGDTLGERASGLLARLWREELPEWAKVPDWRYGGRVMHEDFIPHAVGGRMDEGLTPAMRI